MYLRPYRSADLDVLFALDRVCFEPRFRFSRTMMRQVVESPGALVLLACADGVGESETVQGFCAVQIDDGGPGNLRFGYVSTLDVAPAARGQGTGKALMRAMHDRVLRAEGESMMLHVFIGNLPAIRLYESLGYERIRQERDFYGAGFDAWLYRSDLGRTTRPAR